MMSNNTMKAIVYTTYGPPEVLQFKEVEKPRPKDDEVLIKNYGSLINTVDIVFRSGKAPPIVFWGARQLMSLVLRLSVGGLRTPKQKIPGSGFAGEIVAIGKDVTH
jgi:NADPH:quinone reductase-like Zn-dependent oxidoreductase